MREAREALGLSQEAAGDLVGVSQQSIAKAELDRWAPVAHVTVLAFAEKFGVPPEAWGARLSRAAAGGR